MVEPQPDECRRRDIVYDVYRLSPITDPTWSGKRRVPEFENLVDSCVDAVPRV